MALNDEQINATLREFEKIVQARREEQAAEQQKNAAVFLANNAKQPGVKVLTSGLQYKVLKTGNGPSPKATDTVSTHYHGTLVDGTVFDSSVQRGTPAQFPVNRVIPGWTEALQLMKVGDKWQLVIPSKLGYGDRGSPPVIPPSATLIFEVELLDIVR